MMTSRPRFWYAFLLLPVLLGAKAGKKGCCGKEETVETVVVDTPPPPEQPLQIVSIDPSVHKPNEGFQATVRGANIKDGASVKFNSVPANSTTFVDENTVRVNVPALEAGRYDVTLSNPDGKSSTMRMGLTIKSSIEECRFVRVNYDFDSSTLRGDGKATLDRAVPCYQSASGKISIEGHADERGTTEYNLQLGQRRADTVKKYLSGAGVAATRLSSTSSGEERPVASGHDEGAWAQNRRADISAEE